MNPQKELLWGLWVTALVILRSALIADPQSSEALKLQNKDT